MVSSGGQANGQDKELIGSGGHSIAGYEYQIDVSVWLALDLVLASKQTHELVLEPATEEDIEAELEEYEPGKITNAVALGGYRLIVQAKLRSGDAWTVAGVKALLKHGKVRESAAKRLQDPNARYLLVTSAGLNGLARGLSVSKAGNWPKAGDMPISISKKLPLDSAGRVAVIGNLDEERLATRINDHLRDSFRVPNARLGECYRALRDEARIRISGAGGGRWERRELEEIICRYDGYIASSPELALYVHPTNWEDLKAAILDRHAVLIIGQSGTGKTMATRKLYEELRELVPGLTRVPITHGPRQIQEDLTEPPVLYDVEDPWGRYDFDPNSRPWNDQLERFFSDARHDRMIVATSRRDVAQSAGVLETVNPWIIGLEAEHYGEEERRRLYQTRIDALPRKVQALAKESESKVLDELSTPLEIQKFFDALAILKYEERRNSAAFIAEAIKQAHQNSIELTVINQVEERDDIRAAAVIWGLLKANDKLSLPLLRRIEEELAEKDDKFERGVSPLVSFFVAARNLRQSESMISYYHPRVEAGLEQALSGKRLIAQKALRLLIDVLVLADESDKAWGVAATARMLLAIDKDKDLKPEPFKRAQEEIDAWLANELSKGGEGFEKCLELAAAAGSQGSNVAEVARFLLHRQGRDLLEWMTWTPPEHDEAWYERMRDDQSVKQMVETFIQEVLPNTRQHFPNNFVVEAERLAPDLTSAFLAAADKIVQFGYIDTSDAIAEGALNDIEGFEAIVDAAVQVLTLSDATIRSNEETRLALINGEYSEMYAEHLAQGDDEGMTASDFLDAYVLRVRQMFGWRRLSEHRHRDKLLFYWFRSLCRDDVPDQEELTGAFAVGHGTKNEGDLWHALARAWYSTFEQALIERVIEGHPEEGVREGALTCLIERVPGKLASISQMLVEQRRDARLVEIAVELGELRYMHSRFDASRHGDAAERATEELPSSIQEICKAAFAVTTKTTPTLSEGTCDYLRSIAAPSEKVRVFRVALDHQLSMYVPDDIRWLLTNSDNSGNAEEAMAAAIRHGMLTEINNGLSHRFSHVVALALTAVAQPLQPPMPESILTLASVKGSPVLKALVKVLDEKPHVDHMSTLLHLAKDEWSDANYYGGDDGESYPIAKAAIKAIAKLGVINDDVADELYHVAINTRDVNLRYKIFALLARTADQRFQTQLFELAVHPGRRPVLWAAAHALLVANEHIAPEVVVRITPQLLMSRVEYVASRLLLLMSLTGTIDDVIKSAEVLAVDKKRRVLLLLVIWIYHERDLSVAKKIAKMLPVNHAGTSWALAGAKGTLDDTALDDLGDPLSVEQVLFFMNKND